MSSGSFASRRFQSSSDRHQELKPYDSLSETPPRRVDPPSPWAVVLDVDVRVRSLWPTRPHESPGPHSRQTSRDVTWCRFGVARAGLLRCSACACRQRATLAVEGRAVEPRCALRLERRAVRARAGCDALEFAATLAAGRGPTTAPDGHRTSAVLCFDRRPARSPPSDHVCSSRVPPSDARSPPRRAVSRGGPPLAARDCARERRHVSSPLRARRSDAVSAMTCAVIQVEANWPRATSSQFAFGGCDDAHVGSARGRSPTRSNAGLERQQLGCRDAEARLAMNRRRRRRGDAAPVLGWRRGTRPCMARSLTLCRSSDSDGRGRGRGARRRALDWWIATRGPFAVPSRRASALWRRWSRPAGSVAIFLHHVGASTVPRRRASRSSRCGRAAPRVDWAPRHRTAPLGGDQVVRGACAISFTPRTPAWPVTMIRALWPSSRNRGRRAARS